ncbi:MAG: glutamine synthetase family protein, partial [Candidatus Ranarchaeia archaeon]
MIDRYDKHRSEIVKQVIKKIRKNNIKFCWLHFVDLSGILKSVGVRTTKIEDILNSGISFDGSSITGFGRIEESDMVAVPDPTTFALIPWRSKEYGVARFICDIYNSNECRYEGDSRYILQRASSFLKKRGFEYQCAPEMEFFWLKSGGEGIPIGTDLRGYFDADPGDEDQLMRREVSLFAEKFPGLKVETLHHEVAASQHEIGIGYGPAVSIADACITMKMLVKTVGSRHQMIGTFIPKPFYGHNGSGMHIHQSIWNNGRNVFFDDKDKEQISQILRYFIGGQLKYSKEMSAILNSWPNSYKRLIPGFEAPTYIAYGFKNRSMLIRIPNFFNSPNAARCEIRSPDGAGNPYLQFAVLMMTGLEGIQQKISPPPPVELDVFHVSKEECSNLGVKNLPKNFGEALDH